MRSSEQHNLCIADGIDRVVISIAIGIAIVIVAIARLKHGHGQMSCKRIGIRFQIFRFHRHSLPSSHKRRRDVINRDGRRQRRRVIENRLYQPLQVCSHVVFDRVEAVDSVWAVGRENYERERGVGNHDGSRIDECAIIITIANTVAVAVAVAVAMVIADAIAVA
jgi:hypothetical protein